MPRHKEKKREYDTKRLQGKGDRKMRPCLGPDCKKKIVTTPETRLCISCKRKNEQLDGVGDYEVYLGNQGGREE